MSDPIFDATPEQPAGFYSLDTVIIIDDGPGDLTVRPLQGESLKLALAERERIARWQDWAKQASPKKESNDQDDAQKSGA